MTGKMGKSVLTRKNITAVVSDKFLIETGKGTIDDTVELGMFLDKAIKKMELGTIDAVVIQLAPDKTIKGVVTGVSKDVKELLELLSPEN